MSATPIAAADAAVLAEHVAGPVFTPESAVWDEVRQAWNLSADQHPVAVVYAESAEDVRAVVRHAAARGLRVAPQGTGHNATARTSLERSILLRTDRMRGVGVDPQTRIVRAEAGVLWLEVMEAVAPHGLVALCGSSPDVGVVGYTLGGGIGWLSRELGLACESVTAIEVVTADGELRRCTADEHGDLFWALRGGSGSYGVVTAIEFRAHAVEGLTGGAMLWPWERAREVLQAWRTWCATAPESVTTSARILQVPPIEDVPEPLRGRQFVVLDGAVIGSPEHAAEVLAPLRALGPEIDMFGPTDALGLPRIHMDPEAPMPGMSDHAMLGTIDEALIDRLVDAAGPASGSPVTMVELRHLGGALGRREKGCGALGRLDAGFAYFAAGMDVPGLAEACAGHLPRIRAALGEQVTDGCYLNFQEATTDPERAFPIDCHTRLRQVKGLYDPQDVIHANHAVEPLLD